jgi:diadenylate cyclase
VIVLFQADIRRALSHLGRAPFFRYLARAGKMAETIEEVVTAAGMLAAARVGAIVAFEREIGLRNYVESGIPIDAAVSYDLITTIFQPGTPIHDGAVIIQEDRLAAAACFLPLTVSPQIDKDLGTRHRAAIGLTEESDAVAVIVSEERGEISLSQGGRIERRLTQDELRTRLQALLLQRREPGRTPAPAREVETDI